MEKIDKVLRWSVFISLIVLLAIETKFFSDFEANYLSFLSDVIMAILIGSIVAIALNKYILKDQLNKQLELLNVSQNVTASGFSEFFSSFDQVELKKMMSSSKEVEIYVTYADRVLGSLSKIMKKKLADENFYLNIFISDKENPFLSSYAQLWQIDSPNYDVSGLRSNIDGVISEIKNLKKNLVEEGTYHNNLKLYSVKYHPVFFSFYRFDNKIIYVPSKLIETKNVPIPSFEFENTLSDRDMFSWINNQLVFIKDSKNNAVVELKL